MEIRNDGNLPDGSHKAGAGSIHHDCIIGSQRSGGGRYGNCRSGLRIHRPDCGSNDGVHLPSEKHGHRMVFTFRRIGRGMVTPWSHAAEREEMGNSQRRQRRFHYQEPFSVRGYCQDGFIHGHTEPAPRHGQERESGCRGNDRIFHGDSPGFDIEPALPGRKHFVFQRKQLERGIDRGDQRRP